MVSRILIALVLFGAAHLHAAEALDVVAGKALFMRNWVSSPSATRSAEGLGPLYDARSCNACHIGGGPGRISAHVGGGLVVRIARADGTPDPIYGLQLQTRSLPGLLPEAKATIDWAGGGRWRVADLRLSNLAYGPLAPHVHAGLRRAPSLAGLGELASISDAEVLAIAEQERRSGGSGRASIVTDGTRHPHVGRWGWKAAGYGLDEQIAAAMQRDIGLSTSFHPAPWGECTAAEIDCRHDARRKAHNVDASDAVLRLVAAYASSLPTPRSVDLREPGYAVFRRIGCARCHANLRNEAGESVYAMTDLLLHDMGPALADGVGEAAARPSQWRTAPLWTVADDLAAGGLLHDGRAASVAEAVHWHGGEAGAARARFAALTATQQHELESFLLRR